MPVDQTLEVMLDRCFDAVAQPDNWSDALEGLAATLGASGAAFNSSGAPTDRNRLRLPASPRYRDMLSEFIADGWAEQDLRARRGWAMAHAGRKLLCEDDLTTADERARSPIYRDLFSRHRTEMFAGLTVRLDGQQWNLNLVRPAGEGAFTGRQISRFTNMRPTLRRLLMFARHASRAESQGALAALDHLDMGAAMLDRRGVVQQVNAVFEGLAGRGVDLRGGRLVVGDPASQAALDAQIAGSLEGRLQDATVVRVRDRDPLIVETVPLTTARSDIFGLSGVLLLITDTAAGPAPSLDLLRQVFGLTAREGAVAQALAEGEGSKSIADRMALRETSVRQIVKSVLDKTDTHRQSELAAKLARLPRRPRF